MDGCSFEFIVEEDTDETESENKNDDLNCAVCFNETTGAHRCKSCGKAVHVPCGIPVGEEGYGQEVICFICNSKEKEANNKKGEKRQVMWDWKKGCFGKEKHPIPEKKRKKVDNKSNKGEKYVCLQCLEQHLKGKQDERFKSMCRADTSSITRHKKRWHYLPDAKPCTIVPESAPEVSALRKSYDKMKQKKNSTTLLHTDDFKIQPALQRPEEKMKKFSSETDDAMETTNTTIHDDSVDLQRPKLAPPEPHPLVKNQSTLFTSAGSKSAEKTTDTSLKQVIDAVAELNLKVDSIAKQHRTLEQLALEDGEVRKSLSAMRRQRTSSNLQNCPMSYLNGSMMKQVNALSYDVCPVSNFMWKPSQLLANLPP